LPLARAESRAKEDSCRKEKLRAADFTREASNCVNFVLAHPETVGQCDLDLLSVFEPGPDRGRTADQELPRRTPTEHHPRRIDPLQSGPVASLDGLAFRKRVLGKVTPRRRRWRECFPSTSGLVCHWIRCATSLRTAAIHFSSDSRPRGRCSAIAAAKGDGSSTIAFGWCRQDKHVVRQFTRCGLRESFRLHRSTGMKRIPGRATSRTSRFVVAAEWSANNLTISGKASESRSGFPRVRWLSSALEVVPPSVLRVVSLVLAG
jgi:hypothetical protein